MIALGDHTSAHGQDDRDLSFEALAMLAAVDATLLDGWAERARSNPQDLIVLASAATATQAPVLLNALHHKVGSDWRARWGRAARAAPRP